MVSNTCVTAAWIACIVEYHVMMEPRFFFLKNIISLSIQKQQLRDTWHESQSKNLTPLQQLSSSEIKFGKQQNLRTYSIFINDSWQHIATANPVATLHRTAPVGNPCSFRCKSWESSSERTPITSGKQKTNFLGECSFSSWFWLHLTNNITYLRLDEVNSLIFAPTWVDCRLGGFTCKQKTNYDYSQLTASWIFIARVLTTPPTKTGHLHVQHRDPLPRTYSIAPGGTNRGEHILGPSCRIDVRIHNSNNICNMKEF